MSDQHATLSQDDAARLARVKQRYQAFEAAQLQLDMTRGKPSPEQLDLSLELLDQVSKEDYHAPNGQDCRNYGGLDGLPSLKQLFADLLDVQVDEVLIGDNASLSLMHDAVVNALLHGVVGGKQPWRALPKVKFLCPAPGYDRHFNICQHLGIEMMPVDLTDEGPDMDQVEALLSQDEAIKGMWCVPRYSNPTGIVYSDEVVNRLAGLKAAAPDFRILWDNAYVVHHLVENPKPLKSLLLACQEAGNPDRAWIFGSTSKISFAGAGVAAMAASRANLDWMLKHRFMQTIGPDKLNQLRHVRFFKDRAGVQAHMRRHAAILKPKFEVVDEILTQELGDTDMARWTKPEGGYFISLDTEAGCAKRVVELAARAGVKLTAAGATFPYRKDPLDRNIRIAPSLPSLEELRQATEVLAVCIQLVSLEHKQAKAE